MQSWCIGTQVYWKTDPRPGTRPLDLRLFSESADLQKKGYTNNYDINFNQFLYGRNGVSLDRTCRSVYHMSSTTLDNPAMYDVWCCQRWWILAATASSPVGNLRQVRKKQTTDAVFVFLFGSQVMLNQDELNIAGHPLWIWSVVWPEQAFQIFCFVRSFLGAFVPYTVEQLLSNRWVQEIICGSLCSVPLQTEWVLNL